MFFCYCAGYGVPMERIRNRTARDGHPSMYYVAFLLFCAGNARTRNIVEKPMERIAKKRNAGICRPANQYEYVSCCYAGIGRTIGNLTSRNRRAQRMRMFFFVVAQERKKWNRARNLKRCDGWTLPPLVRKLYVSRARPADGTTRFLFFCVRRRRSRLFQSNGAEYDQWNRSTAETRELNGWINSREINKSRTAERIRSRNQEKVKESESSRRHSVEIAYSTHHHLATQAAKGLTHDLYTTRTP